MDHRMIKCSGFLVGLITGSRQGNAGRCTKPPSLLRKSPQHPASEPRWARRMAQNKHKGRQAVHCLRRGPGGRARPGAHGIQSGSQWGVELRI